MLAMMPRTLPPPAVPDAELVRRFVVGRDEAAFELLVWRYRGLVADVCRRALGHTHDAEDASQATFLILARKAGSVRGDALAPWLARVAHRCAVRMRRSRKPHTTLPDVPTSPPSDPLDAHLDAELDRLPEKYRRPIVLCYLHGLSYAQACEQLRCPTGTLCGWLTRGKELLRKRLARRGGAVSAGAFAAYLGGLGASSASHHQVREITSAAVAFAAGEHSSGPPVTVAHGVLNMMSLRRFTVPIVCGLVALLVGAATLLAADPKKSDEPKPVAKVDPKSDAERLNGVWVFDGYRTAGGSGIGQVWGSVVTVADGKFSITKVYGSSKPFAGTLSVDEAKKAIDFKLDGFDLSSEGMPLKLSPTTVLALYKLDGDTLTLALELNSEGKRPTDFTLTKKRDALLTLKRAPKDFKAFPTEVTVKVIGPDDKPAGGAVVCGYMHRNKRFELTDRDGKPLVIELVGVTPEELEKQLAKLPDNKDLKEHIRTTLNPPPGTLRDPDTGWTYHQASKTAADGALKVAIGEAQSAVMIAHDGSRKLIGVTPVTPWKIVSGGIVVKLQPECRVVVPTTCTDVTKDGGKLDEHFNCYIHTPDGQRIAYDGNKAGKLEFILPPGEYTLDVYGNGKLTQKMAKLTVPVDQSEYTAPAVDVPASELFKLIGQPAPELTDVVGWKGEAVKLADLKGKVVLLEFWGYWCGPCIASMPVLYELHDKFKDKGLVIIGVHVDADGEVDSAKVLDEKLTAYKKEVWKGRDLPFPSVLVSGKLTEKDARGVLAEKYGIRSYPSTILIDRDGKVVGKLHAREAKSAAAEMEKILKAEKK